MGGLTVRGQKKPARDTCHGIWKENEDKKEFVRGRLMRLEWTSSSSRVFHSSTLCLCWPILYPVWKKLRRSIHNVTRGALGTTEETNDRSIVLVDEF